MPGDFPVPRVSHRITTYPSGTHHSGFTVSQCMYGPRSGTPSQAAGFHWLKWMSFGYGPSVMITGNVPASAGRKTSATTVSPSRSGIDTSFSTTSEWLMRASLAPASVHSVAAASEARLVGPVVLAELRLLVLARLRLRFVLLLHGAPGTDGPEHAPHAHAASRHLPRLARDASAERTKPGPAHRLLQRPTAGRPLRL